MLVSINKEMDHRRNVSVFRAEKPRLKSQRGKERDGGVGWRAIFTFNLSRARISGTTGTSHHLGGRPSVFLLPLFVVCFLTQVRVPAVALRLISVDVPSPTIVGESVELSCLYDLQDEPLYSVKWYKDDVEFYRYVPNDWPPAQYLPAPGIKIDLTRSNAFTAFLRNVDLNSAGTYRCEVSAEAPSFATEEAEKVLQVLVLPSQGPTILGGRSKYRVGDTVNVNCTSAKSKPAAVLKWYINGLQVKPEYEVDYATTLHDDGLESSSLGLRFSTTRAHFEKGNMKLKCMATVSQIYTMSNEEVVFGGLQQTSGLLQISENDGQAVRSSANNSSRNSSKANASAFLILVTSLVGQLPLLARLRINGRSPFRRQRSL